jgi:hypothetical protein
LQTTANRSRTATYAFGYFRSEGTRNTTSRSRATKFSKTYF